MLDERWRRHPSCCTSTRAHLTGAGRRNRRGATAPRRPLKALRPERLLPNVCPRKIRRPRTSARDHDGNDRTHRTGRWRLSLGHVHRRNLRNHPRAPPRRDSTHRIPDTRDNDRRRLRTPRQSSRSQQRLSSERRMAVGIGHAKCRLGVRRMPSHPGWRN